MDSGTGKRWPSLPARQLCIAFLICSPNARRLSIPFSGLLIQYCTGHSATHVGADGRYCWSQGPGASLGAFRCSFNAPMNNNYMKKKKTCHHHDCIGVRTGAAKFEKRNLHDSQIVTWHVMTVPVDQINVPICSICSVSLHVLHIY